jgi:hypothetical protein
LLLGIRPPVPENRATTRGNDALVTKVDDHVGFIAAYFACSGFFLFFLDFTGCRLHVHPLAAYGHLGFIPTFFAHTHFDFVSHFRLLLNFLLRFYQMRVRNGVFPVIAVVIIAELKFQYFANRFQNSQGLVHSGDRLLKDTDPPWKYIVIEECMSSRQK